MANINTFPPLNYDLIDVNAYMNLSGTKQLDYISSQGCRFRCSFCADPFMYNRGWFGYTPERMVEEIYHLWKKYKFNWICTYFSHNLFHVNFPDTTNFYNLII